MPHIPGHEPKVGELYNPDDPTRGRITEIGPDPNAANRAAEAAYLKNIQDPGFTGVFQSSRPEITERVRAQEALIMEGRAQAAETSRLEAQKARLQERGASELDETRLAISKLSPVERQNLERVAADLQMPLENAYLFLNRAGGLGVLQESFGIDPFDPAYASGYETATAGQEGYLEPDELQEVGTTGGLEALASSRVQNMLESIFGGARGGEPSGPSAIGGLRQTPEQAQLGNWLEEMFGARSTGARRKEIEDIYAMLQGLITGSPGSSLATTTYGG